VKATPAEQARLLELQAADTRLQQLNHSANSLPELATLKALEGESAGLRVTAAEQSGVVDDVRAEIKRLESDVALVETRIARDTERMNGSSSAKDVAALEQELAALHKRQGDLEEIELTVMERLEQHEGELAVTQAALDAIAEKVGTAEAARDAALAEIDAERASTAESRRVLQTMVPAELLDLYERQRARYGFGASLLRFGVSSATGVTLLADELARIRAADPDEVLLCPSSDAILVRTAESGL
jgi:uncharacterized protein